MDFNTIVQLLLSPTCFIRSAVKNNFMRNNYPSSSFELRTFCSAMHQFLFSTACFIRSAIKNNFMRNNFPSSSFKPRKFSSAIDQKAPTKFSYNLARANTTIDLCFQICVIQTGNLDAPRRSTCLESLLVEQLSLKKLGLVPEVLNKGEEAKPAFWSSTG